VTLSIAVTDPGMSPAAEQRSLLRVEGLRVEFTLGGRRTVRAVDDLSLTLDAGGSLGVVGESGCGKTTLARAILRLIPAAGGRIHFNGHDVLASRGAALRALRREMQIVFQDPYSSLNPRRTIGATLAEPLEIHRLARGAALRARVGLLLGRVGLSADAAGRYPHEFSGGQRQRIAIARALATEPRLLICDECVSALDVSVQAQIINLLDDLRRERGLALLFISHNLAVVRHLCDQILVMLQGRAVEHASCDALFRDPRHSFSRALLDAVRGRRRVQRGGAPPSAGNRASEG